MPVSTLRLNPHGLNRKTAGQDGVRFLLSRKALSSSTTCRFIPAHSTSKLSTAFRLTQPRHLLTKTRHTAATRPLTHRNIASSLARIGSTLVFQSGVFSPSPPTGARLVYSAPQRRRPSVEG